MSCQKLSIVVPTYGRDSVLCRTIEAVRSLQSEIELIIVDQSPSHDSATTKFLHALNGEGSIRWVHRQPPSIPMSMNFGLREARNEIVLFIDDDIVPDIGLIDGHFEAHQRHPEASAVAGQVLQPGEEPQNCGDWVGRRGFLKDLDFPFWSTEPAWVSNVMAGNLSVKRGMAISAGGFDENFDGVAYRFETEFARRLERTQGPIYYEPRASIRHLRASRGGTRSTGSHLTSASAKHGAGDYYFAMRSGLSWSTLSHIVKRPFREVRTRFHLANPWFIPVKLLGEFRAFVSATAKTFVGPKYIRLPTSTTGLTAREISVTIEEN